MLKTNFLGFDLQCPLTVGSGTFGYGDAYKKINSINELGILTTKGLSLMSREGNPQPRIAQIPMGLLNSVGLENPGFAEFKEKVVPAYSQLNVPIMVNISGRTIEEYQQLAAKLNEIAEIALIELNISCPNVKEGGILFGTNLDLTRETVRAVRQVLTKKKLIVKLSPSVSDIQAFAKVCEDEGADALCLINTIPALHIDIKTKKPVLGNGIGGLSGPAIKPIAVRMVYQVAQVVNIPIIGMGGITSTEDAIEFMMAGASIIGIGTGLFQKPNLIQEIKTGLQQYCQENNLNNIQEIVGAAHEPRQISA
ncbi:dihydroorotate dehydrogenase (NAD+) catalytic subunit [Entomoplasma freundtii]|uniref:Dihydroorotate dehydrogenase n=1 Tax=Entomoplasma freundtii TaxID=74700 RepID=A0A2K8NSI8_9MOLU|nr:dihydroorotate dehydrogenase [Entomoplasma freundtii]ATZ16128.1 dihydroorotate dehydrogenase (NAD+) catalytic subunit [Entomoplasma freundtii]TDY56971.1 dihydroorotate dehydrogenase (NAD+) catalytic subunit [Entomoplasma freundtii]